MVQRYISTRPLFIDARELALGPGVAQVTDPSSAITALRSLTALYKAITQAVREEAVIMEQVFPAPQDALVMFVTRLFEQRVQVGAYQAMLLYTPCQCPSFTPRATPRKSCWWEAVAWHFFLTSLTGR